MFLRVTKKLFYISFGFDRERSIFSIEFFAIRKSDRSDSGKYNFKKLSHFKCKGYLIFPIDAGLHVFHQIIDRYVL